MSELRTLRNYIDGEFRDAADGRTTDVVSPVTGEAYATAPLSGAADVDAAMAAAAAAFPAWRDATPAERQKALLKIADAVEARAEELIAAESENTGKPIGLTRDRGDPADGRPDPLLRRCGTDAGGQVGRRVHGGPDLLRAA